MPNIILKKTFKIKAGSISAEKSFSFHGRISRDLVERINNRLATFRLVGSSNRVKFSVDKQGHFFASMNHDCQKYHEEDAVAMILDVMEENGYQFRFQYDVSTSSLKSLGALHGGSTTSKELFVFQRS